MKKTLHMIKNYKNSEIKEHNNKTKSNNILK